MKLEINYTGRKTLKPSMETKQHAIKKQWVNRRKQRWNQKIPQDKNKTNFSDPMVCSRNKSKRKFIPVKTRKISNYTPSKELEKEEKQNLEVIRRKEIIKMKWKR